jgi:hypothetical protein
MNFKSKIHKEEAVKPGQCSRYILKGTNSRNSTIGKILDATKRSRDKQYVNDSMAQEF